VKNLAVIPARSGSKGLKDKNIKLLNGKPLLAYTIEAALETKIFTEVVVSTDSEEYANIARSFGANVPFLRDKSLATDTSSSWDVVIDVLNKYKELGDLFDIVALLQPTSPLRTANDILSAYNDLLTKDANAIISVSEVDHSPLWANTLPKDNSLTNFIRKEIINLPRQKLPKYYRINGAIYLVKTKYLLSVENIYKDKCYAFIMDKNNSVDIDDKYDFKYAEFILNNTES